MPGKGASERLTTNPTQAAKAKEYYEHSVSIRWRVMAETASLRPRIICQLRLAWRASRSYQVCRCIRKVAIGQGL